ncbi:MAG: hypothetical protein CSB44_04660 [Gammaproteobacteria bacterium]|nr:MAG: hypothetical protein CSB44_04660 [Gammaproteobacteria bacterium]
MRILHGDPSTAGQGSVSQPSSGRGLTNQRLTSERRASRGLVAGVLLAVVALPVHANVWVFDPSVALDQRFDDNYYLDTKSESRLSGTGTFSATRVVGELGISRETERQSFEALLRIDGLLTANDRYDRNILDSNQLFRIDFQRSNARSRFGIRGTATRDTPSRDIAADLTEESDTAVDTGGITISQSTNQVRNEFRIEPSFGYDVSRRLSVDNRLSVVRVEHELPDPQDAIYAQYLLSYQGDYENIKGYDEVTIEDVGIPFTPTGELSDFTEIGYTLSLRYSLSRRSTITGLLGYSDYRGDVEPASWVSVPYDELELDSSNRDIARKPARDSLSNTSRVLLGLEHQLTPTIRLDFGAGAYLTETDETDTWRPESDAGSPPNDAAVAGLESESDGWLANAAMTIDNGRTRYTARYATDVQPSSIGTQVETHDLTGSVFHTIGPRQKVSARLRLYEPGRVGDEQEDRFARRFLSIEPRYSWDVTRDWTFSAGYRYRRQKAMNDIENSESNAVLISIKYSPPSEVRDAQLEKGL